jgi:hypothetical protein
MGLDASAAGIRHCSGNHSKSGTASFRNECANSKLASHSRGCGQAAHLFRLIISQRDVLYLRRQVADRPPLDCRM